MILSGEKKEEYRDIKPYWCSILIIKDEPHYTQAFWKGFLRKTIDNKTKYYPKYMSYFKEKFNIKGFDTITFSNGYAKNRDQFEIEILGIDIREGNTDWGAEKGLKYFVLELGKIT